MRLFTRALAGRIGVKLDLDDWDRLGREIPTIVNRRSPAANT